MNSQKTPVVAYFSAEYAIADDLPIYAGGLGVLAADIVMEAGAQNREFYAVGLVYHQAFTGDDPDQRPMTERLAGNGFELALSGQGERLLVNLELDGRSVTLQAWVKKWQNTQLILLDARVTENDEQDQIISDHLYPRDAGLQLKQEACLGIGGIAMLEAMDIRADVYHLNEGHSALAGLGVVLRNLRNNPRLTFGEAVKQAKTQLVGTKHTILPGAGLVLDWATVSAQLKVLLEASNATVQDLQDIASKATGDYSGTHLLIALTGAASGVSKIHVMAELRDHHNSKLIPITNGIYCWRWTTRDWLEHSVSDPDDKFWAMHNEARHQLIEHVRQQTGNVMDTEKLTVVWARRMAAYKRPELLVSDIQRLSKLIHDTGRPVQFIVAGRANPADELGVELMNRVIEAARRPDLSASFAYLPHYNTISARFLVRGADVWLNTPVRGYEACGTSGMKASLNGALQLTTSDGWTDEVDIESIGWRLPANRSAEVLYELLEQDVAPLFYKRTDGIPHDWIKMMRANARLINHRFTASRMLDDYYSKLYAATP